VGPPSHVDRSTCAPHRPPVRLDSSRRVVMTSRHRLLARNTSSSRRITVDPNARIAAFPVSGHDDRRYPRQSRLQLSISIRLSLLSLSLSLWPDDRRRPRPRPPVALPRRVARSADLPSDNYVDDILPVDGKTASTETASVGDYHLTRGSVAIDRYGSFSRSVALFRPSDMRRSANRPRSAVADQPAMGSLSGLWITKRASKAATRRPTNGSGLIAFVRQLELCAHQPLSSLLSLQPS